MSDTETMLVFGIAAVAGYLLWQKMKPGSAQTAPSSPAPPFALTADQTAQLQGAAQVAGFVRPASVPPVGMQWTRDWSGKYVLAPEGTVF